MQVHLAGYNIDASILTELKTLAKNRSDLTPEVLSASYARISRDSRPISEIRQEARKEVERTRKSNQTIIFKMGHHSVAEHAVFNLDIIGVSRLAMEELEKFRLCSYTEKSQRYITLDKDFVLPNELKNTKHQTKFLETIKLQNNAYAKFYAKLKDYVFKCNRDLANDPKQHNLLEGWAKEDARYITSLATQSQVGMTVNARNLELLLRRFASHNLAEVNQLGREIYAQVSSIAPSIVIFHQANDRDQKTYPELKNLATKLVRNNTTKSINAQTVILNDYPKNGDITVAAAILHSTTNISFSDCIKLVKKLNAKKRKEIFKTAFKNLQFYDSLLREFEYVNLTYNIILSAACFGQLKRHRMASLSVQPYDPALGITIPDAIKATGLAKEFNAIAKQSENVYHQIKKELPGAADYILTNAHRRRALMRVNPRELYHISRLREDKHAQWDIRNISLAMTKQAKKIMPLTFELIGPKDQYNQIYQNIFGCLPKITQATLPQAKAIK